MTAKSVVAAALASAALALSACGSKQACLVLANGSQLCGSAAAAWCQMTEAARDSTPVDPVHRLADAEALMQTIDSCAAVSR